MAWQKVKLGKIAEVTSSKRIFANQYVDKGIPFYRQKEIIERNNKQDVSEPLFISQDLYEEIKKKYGVPCEGDLLITGVGVTLGIPYVVGKEVFYFKDGNLIWLKKFSQEVNSKFVYYYISSEAGQKAMWSRTIGAAQPALTIDLVKQYEIPLPPLATQQKIADILSAYDNLIENNQKQIKLLEEAAQRLYKQWFIDLRYPGHETTPIVDGLPEGWKKEKLVEIIDYEIGGGWGEDDIKEKCDQPAFVIRGTDFYGITHGEILNIPFRYHSKTNLDARALCDGDIIFEVSGGSKTEGVAKTVLIKQALLDHLKYPVMCASFCKLIRLKNRKLSQYMYDAFFYLRKSGKTAEYDKRSASSIVNYRWKDFLNEVDILIPPNNIVEMYNGIASSAYERIINFSLSIETAKKTRDRLLPKLMNGEL